MTESDTPKPPTARVAVVYHSGYGHTRAWELALGGVTRTLLQSMTVPVLMSH